jgi:hypothetical protein
MALNRSSRIAPMIDRVGWIADIRQSSAEQLRRAEFRTIAEVGCRWQPIARAWSPRLRDPASRQGQNVSGSIDVS